MRIKSQKKKGLMNNKPADLGFLTSQQFFSILKEIFRRNIFSKKNFEFLDLVSKTVFIKNIIFLLYSFLFEAEHLSFVQERVTFISTFFPRSRIL